MSSTQQQTGTPYLTQAGVRYPSGVKVDEQGVNFSIFSRHAMHVELLLFATADSQTALQTIELDPAVNKTFFTWHIYVESLPVNTWYAWRMDGPGETRETGRRFDADKILLDPWARAVSDKLWNRRAAEQPGDNISSSMRCKITDPQYDWEADEPLKRPFEQAIIYEMHVGGFSRHASSNVAHPGTFCAVIEKIPYLKSLGITHVELMPVMAFDEQDIPPGTAALGLKNYWGYSTHSFFSPHAGYCVTPEQGTHQNEFRDMVKALHHAGIGVILDVVFNHTAEGGPEGPVINFKGFGSSVFYHLDENDKTLFRDYTGCGNTVNCNHPIVANFIISCLEYWVREMHVDGFRFDLASALARGEDGTPLHDPPVLWGIELSEQLAGTKLIAEAWDAAGLYQVGSFPGYRWAEWNGRYRDVVRRFVRGDKNMISELATRLGGSADFYEPQHRLPINSINFVTCHDGFTLNDLFSYLQKHNEANGENNRDGHNDNLSFNCGIEGPTTDPVILAQRERMAKNVFALLLLSQGVPMLLAGDEVLKSQSGNNNGYCQDNELTWFDWSLVEKNAGMLRFVKQMIALRKRHPSLMRRRFLNGQPVEDRGINDIDWHGAKGRAPDWDDPASRILGFTLAATDDTEADLHVTFNMSDTTAIIKLPDFFDRRWQLAVNTAQASPADIRPPEQQKPYTQKQFSILPRSAVVFESYRLDA